MTEFANFLKGFIAFFASGFLALQTFLFPVPADIRLPVNPAVAPPHGILSVITADTTSSTILTEAKSSSPQISVQPILVPPVSPLIATSTELTPLPLSKPTPIEPSLSSSTINSSTTVPSLNSGSSIAAAVLSEAVDPVIDPQSIVGLSCYFKNRNDGSLVIFDKGSGVIIDPRGYIVTSRHLIDLDFAATVEDRFSRYADAYVFEYCAVGQVSKDSLLPTPDLIRTVNPITRISVLGYKADLVYLPNDAALSDLETEQLDFAVLKITGVTDDGKTFGIASLPSFFPSAKLLADLAPLKEGDEVITYGYPGDVSQGMHSSFGTLYLVGSVGRVTAILGGNDHFLDKPFVINTKMSVSGGRSGSPLFWRGYVIGLVAAYREGDSTDSFSVAAPAILEFLPPPLK